MPKKIVVALGGNAIATKDGSAGAQLNSIKQTAEVLAQFVKAGNQLVVTHGNGPQVGNLLLQMTKGQSKGNPPMPLDTVGAMTQGSIGYWLQKSLSEIFEKENIQKTTATIVTQTIVDQNDEAFHAPSKPIGPFYSKAKVIAYQKEHPGYVFAEDAGRGYRRVVASPRPINIKESPLISLMLENGMVPIAAGGGGIPVIKTADGSLTGVEAVIDKDFSAAKLAENIGADELIILTAVDYAYINYGKSSQKKLGEVTVHETMEYLEQGQFAAGSMLPKIQAANDFVSNTNGQAVITSLKNVSHLITGRSGTVITN
ncbi:carbamate kinase [Ligilactobacillus acidipiscis]|uniref:Carbamate kinase n=1 Tax=Ligilactobacillus acidipiscis TaxID=89059 RepID=A0A0R2K512_9LACO|nr:carbamate kinase [Ligilactobacillus acidipiscis]KRN81495.1 carbamate kinase [Ligilactobacillus acidipiscis]SFV41608.1 Carbamate kinase [Ligilactobacillus acidipiscis]